MLAEYLMPQLLPGRFKVWVEQYGRLPDSFVAKEVCFFLLPQEESPVQISDFADIACTTYRIEDGIWTQINYSGSIASFRALREQVFGTSELYSVQIIEPLTDEETYMMQAWVMRYNMIWPYIDYEGGDRRPHDQLRALYENMKVHERLCLTAPLQPPDGVDYVVRNYVDGLFSSEIRETGALEGSRQAAMAEAQRAIDAIQILPAGPYKDALVALASQLLERRT
jgi:hypothetical protein